MSEFTANYQRTFGAHEFETANGQTVSVLSASDWAEFDALLRDTRFYPGSIVVSPELITVPDPLEDLEQNMSLVHRRVIATQGVTNAFPDVTFLLGAPTLDVAAPLVPGIETDSRPRNSVIAIQNGLRLGAAHKRVLFHSDEQKLFKGFEAFGPSEPQTVPGKPNIGIVVCSDLVLTHDVVSGTDVKDCMLSEPFISPTTDTLLVPAWWAVPLHGREVTDEIFQIQLETFARGIFRGLPQIQDIIVADGSSADNNNVPGPFNVQFQRT